MGSKRMDFSRMVVMLAVTFVCGNCDRVMTSKAVVRAAGYQFVVDRDIRSLHRFRRSVLNQNEMREAVDAHNAVRRLEGASNMEIMTWNIDLASMAEDWAKNCQWRHGQLSPIPSTLPYKHVGQNLFAISAVQSINLTAAVLGWYNEKLFFNYNTLECQHGQVCGHYTQVVWSTSRVVGCAYANCTTLFPSNMTNALFLVCNYAPAGNVNGSKPYRTGEACSNCASGSWWCNKGLCDGNCAATETTCECMLVCRNSGSINKDTCSCSCASGWHGSDCNDVCKDYNSNCNPKPGQFGWPSEWCNHSEFGAAVRESCPAMCNQCQVKSHSTSTLLQSKPAFWLTWLLLYCFRCM